MSKMRKGLILTTGLILAAILFTLAGCTSPGRAPWEEGFGDRPTEEVARSLQSFLSGQQVGIWVSGEGRVSAVPDVALLRLGIEAQAATVAEAQRQGGEAMNGVMGALKAGGVEEKDIKTQRFSIQPVKQWVEEPGTRGRGKEIIVGYRVTNRVTAKIRKIEDAGAIIEAAASAGGDLTRVDSISFTIDDPTPLYAQARERAVLDAKAKAEQLAELSGVTLGKPIYISVGTGRVPMVFEERAMSAAPMPAPAPPPISPGETEIRISVQMVYAIQ
jgi:hypothetical protein